MKTKLLIGVVLILLGIMVMLDQFSFGAWDLVGKYWPVLLILFGIERLSKPYKSKLFSFILIFFGFAILIDNLDLLNVHWGSTIWAFILIAIGIHFILPRRKWKKDSLKESIKNEFRIKEKFSEERISNEGYLNYTNIFAGYETKVVSDNFRGGEVYTIFGGADIDLREVKTKDNIVRIELYAIFGGIDLYVPETWRVQINGTPVFGGISNSCKSALKDEEKTVTLILEAYAVFGGIEVQH